MSTRDDSVRNDLTTETVLETRFDQAYTRVIEDTVRDSFDAVGLRFIANNYAMDGMSSGPELALCMESIYGFDIDILNW